MELINKQINIEKLLDLLLKFKIAIIIISENMINIEKRIL